jgi:S1-C subfamily serine protease
MTIVQDQNQALRSVVALRASVPEDAFTAGVLGTERAGSGVVIRENGLVLTIGYLITEAEEVWLTTADGRSVAGHALAVDAVTGFGLVQALEPLNLPALELGESARLKLGEPVLFAGGAGRTVEAGVVAKQEFAGYWEYLLDEAIFTAPAHSFWGGAGLIGSNGRLLGIGSLMLQTEQGGRTQDINMVVPIDLLKPILDDLVKRGRTPDQPRPWLGLYCADHDGKVVVIDVSEDGPAAKAGLRQGDVLTDVRDGEVSSLADFYRKVWAAGPAGAEITLRAVRDGRDLWVRVKTADRVSFLKKPSLQ